MNAALVMLTMGATFVARTFAADIKKTKEIMQAAMRHEGFAFVDIIQPCITFFDTREYYKERVYWLDEKHNAKRIDSAFKVARSVSDEKVPLGIFYQVEKPTFESNFG
jgi:2-oxoglutarate/2-oxoacid ferredoxin oxidoreductase subunit beta